MYDDTCRFLAETFSAAFASSQQAKAIALTELNPSELSLDPIRADALILLESDVRLEQGVIYRLLRRDVMQESVIYRSIQQEAEARKQREIAINLLRDGFSIEAVARGTGLSIEEVQQPQQQGEASLPQPGQPET